MGAFHTQSARCYTWKALSRCWPKGHLYRVRSDRRRICVSGFLDGRRYNRAVKFHKLMYEVLHSLTWRIFQLRIKRFLEKNLSVHLERIQGHAKVIREVYGCVQAIRL